MPDLMRQITAIPVGAMIGQTGAENPQLLFSLPQKFRVLGVDLTDTTTIAKHSANYGTCAVIRKCTNGTSSVVIAHGSTETVALTANVPKALTLTTTTDNLEIPANEALAFVWAEGGTGQDLVDAVVQVTWTHGYGGGISQA